MALVCDTVTSQSNTFTFIDCSTISINYEISGIAAVSFTVVSTSSNIDLSDYQEVTFGNSSDNRTSGSFTAGSVTYTGYVTGYELSIIPGTSVYEHRLSLIAWGCQL
jgi:hypothetical protein